MSPPHAAMQVVRRIRHPRTTIGNALRRGTTAARDLTSRRTCPACGRWAAVRFQPVITPDIAVGCGFDATWATFYDRREGVYCVACGTNARVAQIATVLVGIYGTRCRSLAELCRQPDFRRLDVAEVNEIRSAHQFFSALPRLRYSEFGSQTVGTPSEDVQRLTYADDSFDLVLTSETLEHVPNPSQAFAEIRRVLRPGGRHIFTVPGVWDRPATIKRAAVVDGEIVHLLPPCYHGGSVNEADCLAFHEFGTDILDLVRSAGFAVDVVTDPINPALKVIVTRRA